MAFGTLYPKIKATIANDLLLKHSKATLQHPTTNTANMRFTYALGLCRLSQNGYLDGQDGQNLQSVCSTDSPSPNPKINLSPHTNDEPSQSAHSCWLNWLMVSPKMGRRILARERADVFELGGGGGVGGLNRVYLEAGTRVFL